MSAHGPRLRMAPAPSGFLHLGNIRTFLFDYLYARGHEGTLILRVEDTDAARSGPEAESYIGDSLHWLGIEWDEGPDVGGPHGPYRQSERERLHREAARELLSLGKAYDCFCTEAELEAERREQQARGQAPRYSRRCLHLTDVETESFRTEGRVPAIRFRVPEGLEVAWDDLVYGRISFRSDDIGDFIILRANGAPIYNLANVVDDHGMEITVGLRSQSHLSNTPRQIMLYQALGWAPPAFAHVPDVNDKQGRKMGKRFGAKGVPEYRSEGYLPEAIVNYLALLGWSPPDEEEFLSLDELKARFSFDRVQRSNAAFDDERLQWFNAQYIRRLPAEIIADRAVPFLTQAGLPVADSATGRSKLLRILPLVQERVRTLAEIPGMIAFFYRPSEPDVGQFKVAAYTAAQIAESLDVLTEALERVSPWTSAAILEEAKRTAEQLGWKHGDLLKAVRIAVTGGAVSPPLTESMEILGAPTALSSLRNAAAALRSLHGA